MRRIMVLLVLLSGCGQTALPTDYPATVGALETTVAAQSTTVTRGQFDNVVLGERVVALQATVTAEANRPTPTLQVMVITATPLPLTNTAALSSTTPISPALPLGSGDCGPLPPDVLDYEDAAGFIGSEATVQGRVVKVGRAKKAVFLNFHDPYQGYFSGVIFISAWKAFPGKFEDLYAGRCVRISGTIKEYQGAPEIIIESPAQVVVLPADDGN